MLMYFRIQANLSLFTLHQTQQFYFVLLGQPNFTERDDSVVIRVIVANGLCERIIALQYLIAISYKQQLNTTNIMTRCHWLQHVYKQCSHHILDPSFLKLGMTVNKSCISDLSLYTSVKYTFLIYQHLKQYQKKPLSMWCFYANKYVIQ